MAKEDGSDQTDLVRFKVQELFLISQFYNAVNNIEYSEKATIKVPKTIKNENLVELNLTAF